MANFCGKCGRPLQEGEVCNCTTQTQVQENVANNEQVVQNTQPVYTQVAQGEQVNNAQTASNVQQDNAQAMPNGQFNNAQAMPNGQFNNAQAMPNGQPNYSQAAPNGQPSQFSQQMAGAANVAGDYAKNIFSTLLDLFKAPADHLKDFACEKNINKAFGFIGAQFILLILLACIAGRKILAPIIALADFSSILLGGRSRVSIPYGKIIFGTLLISAICACLFAVIAMLFNKTYAKVEISFKKGITLFAVKSAAKLPFLAIAVVFMIFGFKLAYAIALISLVVGILLGNLYLHTALDNGSIQDKNKRIYTTFLINGIYFIATVLVIYMYIKLQ